MRLPPEVLLSFILFVSCQNEESTRFIDLVPTPLRSLKETYGVVIVPILSVLSAPSEEASVITVLYRGTIIDIESVSPKREVFRGSVGRWYRVHYQGQRGWVFSTSVDVFEDLYLARQRVQALRTTGVSPN